MQQRAVLLAGVVLIATSCGGGEESPFQAGPQVEIDADVEDVEVDGGQTDADPSEDSGNPPGPDAGDAATDGATPSCGFDYETSFTYAAWVPLPAAPMAQSIIEPPWSGGPDTIAHAEPAPPGTYRWPTTWRKFPLEDLVIPAYQDTMPLFPRAEAWTTPTRCYETPLGSQHLSEDESYDLARKIAEMTTGVGLDDTPEVRTVVGLRGAYPGTFFWNGNQPDRFNDTLLLLWIDGAGQKHFREFFVNTDTGAYNFGYHASSSLRANRRYHYINGWHRGYNALRIAESDYLVRDDTNKNGHWDSHRNGWYPPMGSPDHDRTGSAHNIHTAGIDAPVGTATVGVVSAGCQVIPGIANWLEFIANVWTGEGDPVNYFLVDVRDIPPDVWNPCTPDGTHACPYRIDALPYQHTGDTSQQGADLFNEYSCEPTDESGPEVVYVLATDRGGTLSVSVDCSDPVDIDLHLLDGDDAKACLARDDTSLEAEIGPGRYFIVADTYASGGTEFAGSYTLQVNLR